MNMTKEEAKKIATQTGLTDSSRCARVCAHAFYNDPLDKYFFPDEANRISKQQQLYRFFLRINAYNTIRVSSPKLESLLVVEQPFQHRMEMSISTSISGLSLIRVGVASLSKMIHYQLRTKALRNTLVQDPYWYLALIATSPEHQGKGFARALLLPLLLEAEKNRESFFLETNNSRNLSFYEKLGFRIIDAHTMAKMPFIHYCMIR